MRKFFIFVTKLVGWSGVLAVIDSSPVLRESEPLTDAVDECAVPSFGDTACYDFPESPLPS